MIDLIRKYPLVPVLVAFLITMYVESPTPFGAHPGGVVATHLAKTALVMLVLYPILRWDFMTTPGKGWGVLLRFGKGPLFITTVLLASIIVSITIGRTCSVILAVCAAATALMIGFVEEGVFRRGLFVVAARMFGQRKHAVLYAAAISGALFGFAHVMYSLDFSSAGILSGAVKVIETGTFGFIMCAMLYKSKNYWVVVALHGYFDFGGMLSAFTSTTASAAVGSYVTGDMTQAIIMACANGAMLLFQIPAFIYSVKMLKDAENDL